MKKFINFRTATISMWAMFIVFIATLIFCSTSCTANPSPVKTKQELVNTIMNGEKQKIDTINCEFGLIVSILYDPYYDKCIVQYDDSDIIDREFMAEISADTLYWEEMAELVVDCDNNTLIELLNDIELHNQYKELCEWQKAFEIEDNYKLLEIKTEVYNGINFEYKIIKIQ